MAAVPKGKQANEKRVLGKLEELGKLVYSSTVRTMLICIYTPWKPLLAKWVWSMAGTCRCWVKHGNEIMFIKPTAPRKRNSTP
jgi:hypothetical protein